MLTKDQFSVNLKGALEKKGVTQKWLADKINAPEQNISNYVRGKAFPYPDVLVEIARALDVSVDSLCGLNDEGSNIRTAADQVRALIALRDSGCVIFFDDVATSDGYVYPAMVFLQGRNSDVAAFFSEYGKASAICKQIEMGSDFLSLWVASKIKSMEQLPPENCDLPF